MLYSRSIEVERKQILSPLPEKYLGNGKLNSEGNIGHKADGRKAMLANAV